MTLNMANSMGAFKKNIERGKRLAETIEAKETKPVDKNVTIQAKITDIKAALNGLTTIARPIMTPKLVATPFPPLKLRNKVQLWPITAVRPKIIRKVKPQERLSAKPKKLATNVVLIKPLAISNSSAALPNIGPKTLKAFVAPIFPEPYFRISIPLKALPNMYAEGIEPRK